LVKRPVVRIKSQRPATEKSDPKSREERLASLQARVATAMHSGMIPVTVTGRIIPSL